MAVGLALAGRGGARLARVFGVAIGRSTLLRLVCVLPEPGLATPRAVGIDEYATRKGRTCGAVIIDLQTHRPIDMRPDRETSTVAAWLKERPGIEIVCGDRAPLFAEAAAVVACKRVLMAWHSAVASCIRHEHRSTPHMTSTSSERKLVFAQDITREDVRVLEEFLHTQLGRVSDRVGESGETAFAINALVSLVADSAGLLHMLLKVKQPDWWQKAMIVSEWQRLRLIAHPYNHCDGFDHERWWRRIDRYDADDTFITQRRLATGDPHA
ncbi:transposase [Yinghuangia seranimata]|uniref:transposase n=1 Tax=Yinghuangia seranimata TaxID=408067 RepID=UPI00248ACFD1|nr:transposase [Yinghuangia seranimata]MDI2129134.1 transposase [Yinghuangia seranimata]